MSNKTYIAPVAESVPFDNSTNGFTSDNVQGALEEINVSASPGFSFGRGGKTPTDTWMLRPGGAPSNKTGIRVGFNSANVTQITVSNENINTFDITLYEHEGDEVNLTTLGTVSVAAKRSDTFIVSFAVTTGRQIATRITSGSAKNPGVDVQISGTP